MWIWQKVIKPALEWIGHVETIHTIGQAEFFRTLFWPAVVTVATAVTGTVGDVPIMWIIVASTLAFMGTAQGLLRASEYLERKNPLNKLGVVGVHFTGELLPAAIPANLSSGNRRQRRSQRARSKQSPQMLSPSMISPLVKRDLNKGQVSLELINNASFPISCILQSAATEVAGKTPPRSSFPKKASTVQPGSKFRIHDDPIDMAGVPCGRLAGKMEMLINYGLPGNEQFELRLKGNLDIVVEEFGPVAQTNVGWIN